MTILPRFDERFMRHRQRSTSIAGMVGVLVAGALFFDQLLLRDTIDWRLFAVIATVALVKVSLVVYYRITD